MGEVRKTPGIFKNGRYDDRRASLDVMKRTGYVANEWGEAMRHVHRFLNELSIEESLSNENYFIRLLAVLDSRAVRRRIRKIAENIEEEPEWFRKWIGLRLGEKGGAE